MRHVAWALLFGCTPPSSGVPQSGSSISDGATPPLAEAESRATPEDASAELTQLRVTDDEASDALFGTSVPAGCASAGTERISCLIGIRYASDDQAKELALSLYRETGDVAGVGRDQMLDGGFRGTIHLVPELATGPYRQHLAWVLDAARDFERFFKDLFADQTPPRYRWNALTALFVRSVDRTTPSAYASPWTFSYNVKGSLLGNAAGVRETLFHEFFHTNDAHHGDWTPNHLGADYAGILKRCGPSSTCLDAYAPTETRVRGGTYYAFQQNNGAPVHEYGAELALRYYQEERVMLREGKLSKKAFKCGPKENARAWKSLVDEFFGGRDLVAPCF